MAAFESRGNDTAMIGEPTISPTSPSSFTLLIKKLVSSPSTFSREDLESSFNHLAEANGADPAQVGAFLTALHLTGKDLEADTVAICAKVMGSVATSVDLRADAGDAAAGPVCDIVGTGGDGHNTFNASTTAGIIAAGAGVRVHKHGNKAATSSSGSADLLLSLNIPITTLPPTSLPSLSPTCPFLFLFAPLYHPAMVRVAPIRRALGFPTVFNALGPLINPAKPNVMVVGVYSPSLGPVFAQALKLTGVERAWVVCGEEGLDEVSPQGYTDVWDLKDGEINRLRIDPSSFGLASHPLESVRGASPLQNAQTLHALLSSSLGPSNPIENFVMANAAALLYLSGKASDLKEGVALARESVRSGKATEVLEKFRQGAQEAVRKVEEDRDRLE